MMIYKKLLILNLTAVLFFGCSGDKQDIEIVEEQKTEYVTIMSNDTSVKNFDKYIELAEKATNLKIQLIPLPQNSNDRLAKVTILLSSGDGSVDIVNINDEMLSEFKHTGYLEPLEDRIMTPEVREHFISDYIDSMPFYEGSYYTVPMHTEVLAFWIDTAKLDEFNMTGIYTKDDFIKYIKMASADGNYGYGGAWEKSYVFNEMGTFINLFGGDFYNFQNPKTIEAIKFMKSLVSDGYSPISQVAEQYNSMFEKFVEGNYSSVFMWNSVTQRLVDEQVSEKLNMVPMPTFETNDIYMATWHYCLNKSSYNKDNAYKFLEYAASKEGQLDEAVVLNKFPARMDALYDPSFSMHGLDTLKTYLETSSLRVRPMSKKPMEFIEGIGSLFQKYIFDEIGLDVFCTEAQNLIYLHFPSDL